MLAQWGLALLAATLPFQPTSTNAIRGTGRVVLSAATPVRTEAPPAGAIVLVADARAAGSDDAFDVTRAAESDERDRALAEELEGAPSIELRGGAWLDWYQAAHVRRHEREWTRALRRAHAGGALVRASGGAAAWIAGWAPVSRVALGKPAQDPHDTSLEVPAPGLGLFDAALVGVLSGEPGALTADRVIERAVAYGYRDVLLLSGTAEFEWDPVTRSARVLASDDEAPSTDAVWLDMTAGKRSRDSIRGARVAFLRSGDVFDLATRAIERGARMSDEAWARADFDAFGRSAWTRTETALAPGGADPTTRAPTAPRIRAARFGRDERTLHSARGSSGGVLLDVELTRP